MYTAIAQSPHKCASYAGWDLEGGNVFQENYEFSSCICPPEEDGDDRCFHFCIFVSCRSGFEVNSWQQDPTLLPHTQSTFASGESNKHLSIAFCWKSFYWIALLEAFYSNRLAFLHNLAKSLTIPNSNWFKWISKIKSQLSHKRNQSGNPAKQDQLPKPSIC